MSERISSEYHHRQVGYAIILIVAPLFILVWPSWTSVLILGLILTLFWSFTVEIREGLLHFYFGFGFMRRTIALTDVAMCSPVKHPWYGGYGIRWSPRGMIYIVSGQHAVELTLVSGKKFRIGTDEPMVLCRQIAQSSGKRSSSDDG